MSRILRHKSGRASAFTTKYKVTRLVWYQSFEWVENAIARETEIKARRREKKVALITENNPTWEDLAADWGKQFALKPIAGAGKQQVPHG